MKLFTRLIAVATALALPAGFANAQENYSTWSKYKTVKINTSSTGAATAATVANFPLLVRLDSNSADVFAQAKANGADIRFTTVAGVRLKHERERYDSASKKAEFWVRVDSVVANDTNQAIRMYWGNASAADSSKGSSVFSTANGYLAVWHFNDAVAAKGDTLRDVTGNNHHAIADTTAGAFIPADTAGVIGSGKRFRGNAGTTAINTGGYFSVMNADSALNLNTSTGPWTLSAWASPAVCHSTARITVLSKYANVNSGPTHGRAYALQTSTAGNWRVTNNPSNFSSESTTSGVAEFVADAPCAANAWTYVSGSYNTNSTTPTPDATGAANLKMFRDSAFSATAAATANQQPISVGNASNVYIGRLHNVDRFMRGGVDELRISNVARSADWQKLEYYNQKLGSSIVALGATESTPLPPSLHGFAYVDSAKAADTLVFTVGTPATFPPTFGGGVADSFLVVSGSLPAGVTLNKTSGNISGNASAEAAAADVMVRAYGHAAMGDSVTRTVRVSALPGPTAAFSYGRDTLKTTIGVLADTLSPSYTGRAPTGYSVTPTLPAGLALNATTGKLTGTPTGPVSTGTFTLKGTNATDTVTKALVIVVNPAPATLHGFAYTDSAKAADTLTFSVGTLATFPPSIVGGPVDSFLVVSGTLPSGITLNKTSGNISGNASAATAASDVMVRAYGHAAMGDSVTRTVRVSAALGPTAAFSYGRDTLKTTIGVLADTLSPSYTGRAPTGYSVTPGLPSGLVLNATTGKLTGTPTGPASTGTFTLKGTNATDTVTKSLVIVVATPAPENYASQWAGHKDLYINTTTNGAAITENLTKFPLAIRLDATNFNNGFAQSNATGADIRFTKLGDVVRLPHQVERWDSAAKQGLVWVLVDSIKGNERNQRIRMHWNKAGAPNLSNNPPVFDTANGFVAVWHMNEANVSVGQSLVDATPNATTAKLALQGTATAPVNDSTTPLGVAKTFSGSNTSTNTNGAYFYVADSSASALGLNTVNGPFTISAWAKPVVCASGTRITVISKYNNNNVAGTRAWAMQTAASGSSWRMTLNPNTPDFTAATADNEFVADEVCTTDTWQYVTGKYYSATTPLIGDGVSSANLSISVNAGTPITGVTATQATGTSIGDNSPVFIGRLNGTGNTNNRFMRGTLDEIVVSKVLRSQDWVKLSYETQKAGAIVVTDTLAPAVGIHGNHAARISAVSFTSKPLGNGVLFNLRGAPEGKAVLTLTDMRGRKIWTGAFASGVSELVWDGRENDGGKVPAGIYAVRLTVLDAQGRVTNTFHNKVPLAR